MTEKSYTQRRACALAGIDPRVYRRRSKRPADAELRARMKELDIDAYLVPSGDPHLSG